jgi:hypothetical protein
MEAIPQTNTTSVLADRQTAAPAGILSRMRSPVVGPMLAHRGLSAAFGVLGIVQISAGALRLRTFSCPMLHATGIPCPGCGVSRACGAIITGHWNEALRLHLLAPFFLIASGLFVLAAVLPSRQRDQFSGLIASAERRTALTSILLLALIVYWLARLLYAPHEFARLMRG